MPLIDKSFVWMKHSFLTGVVIFFCNIGLFAQNAMIIADSLHVEGNYKIELKYRQSIYNSSPTNSGNIYNLACCYALLKNKDSAFYYLNKSIDLGQDEGWAVADCDLFNLHEDTRWGEIENKLENIYKEKNSKINTQLGWDIAKMFFKDQAHKAASDNIMKKYGIPSPQMDSCNRVIGNVDSLNILALEKIFDKYGWTNKELIGLEGSERVFIIILHAPLIYQVKYFEMVKNAVGQGDLQKSSIAYLTDKILIKEGKKQLYGTQLKYSHQTKSYEFKPIEDENNVNNRRKEYGLGPIEDYAKNFGFEYKTKP